MFDWIASPEAWIALATLTALEVVLGIDNIIFISILVGRLPEQQRNRARLQGLALAMLTRILLLLSLAWMMRLTEPLFTLMPELASTGGNDHLREALAVSGRDLIHQTPCFRFMYAFRPKLLQNHTSGRTPHID
jgi:predicted tellurium resistance membrane protein TerC